MAVENSDDDISILSHTECDDIDGTSACEGYFPRITVLSSTSSNYRISGSELALRTAYHDLKQRYDKVISERKLLTREIKRMDGLRYQANGGMEVEEERNLGAQGIAAQGDNLSSLDVMALQGHIKSLERQIMVLKSQNQAFQQNCQQLARDKTVLSQQLQQVKPQARAGSQDDPQSVVAQNKQLMHRLRSLTNTNKELTERIEQLEVQAGQAGTGVLKGQTAMEQSQLNVQLEEMRERCRQLELENSQLRAVDSKLVQGVSEIPSYSSLPATEELAELKRVIAGLKAIVLQQREFLQHLGVAGKRPSAPKATSCRMSVPMMNGRRTNSLSTDGVDSPSSPVMVDSRAMMAGGEVLVQPPAAYPPVARCPSQPPHIPSLLLADSSSEEQPPPCGGGLARSSGVPVSPSRTDAIQRQRQQQQTLGGARQTYSEVIARSNQPLKPHSPSHQRNLSEDSGHTEMDSSSRISAAQYINVDSTARNSWSQRGRAIQGVGDGLQFRQELGMPGQKAVTGEGVARQSPTTGNARSVSPGLGPREGVGNGNSGGEQGLGDDRQHNLSPSCTLSGRQCPVCSTDLSHLPMEDFQTHVFECFDDNQSPTNTLHVADEISSDRVCPMCNNLFSIQDMTQEEFEHHVQGHFADDQFEILNP